MKTRIRNLVIALAFFVGVRDGAAQGTAAFTYQGQLRDGGTNANGTYDMEFKLYSADSGGNQVGGTVTSSPSLANGLFTVNLDFGAGAFNSQARWLEINVSGETLNPRVQVLPTPYATFAAMAGEVTNHAIMNAQLATNAVATTNIQNNAITTALLASNAVATFNIQSNAITTVQITNGAVTNPKLAADAVATVNITNGAVSAIKIANGQVVKTLNELTDSVVLSAGLNTLLTTNGNTLQLATVANGFQLPPWTFDVGTFGPYANTLSFNNGGNFAMGIAPNADGSGRPVLKIAGGLNLDSFIHMSGNLNFDNITGEINFQTGAKIRDNHVGGLLLEGFTAINGNVTCGDIAPGNINANGNVSAGDFIGTGNIFVPNGIVSAQHVEVTGNISATNGTVFALAFVNSSDRNMKEKFAPINSMEILERVANLPISSWNFKTDGNTRHIGPMAQDFYSAFNVGIDDKHIATVDEGGVALAAIQGLNEKLKEKDARIEAMEKRLADLEELIKSSTRK